LMQGGRILFDGSAEETLSTSRLSDLYECPVEIVKRGNRLHCLGTGGNAT
jgi:hypothetical protein